MNTTNYEAAADKVERIEAIMDRHAKTCGTCAGGNDCEILGGWIAKRDTAQVEVLRAIGD